MQRGVVLVVVLWLLVLLAVLVATQTVSARAETELVRNRVEGLYARTAAEAGLFTTIDILARELAEKEERSLRTDGVAYRLEQQGVELTIHIVDEAGKIDLNAVRSEMLRKLMVSVIGDVDKGIAVSDAILDWRDSDQQRREAGAEDDEYRQHGRGYGAKDESMENLEELLLVLGVDAELYAKLIGIVTVLRGTAGINPLVAPRAVLLAVPGVTAEEVDTYLKERDRHYTEGLAAPIFPIRNRNYITGNRDQLYSIHIRAVMPTGTTEYISVVARVSPWRAKDGEIPYEILSWSVNNATASLQP